MRNQRVIVVGGGPAGLMAAGEAACAGAHTLLLEKMPRPGRKLSITGKGRCNLTNTAEGDEFIDHFGRTGPFLRQAFARYFHHDLIDFLERLGVKVVVERGGRVFPASGKAPDVTAALVNWARQQGVHIETSSPVDRLLMAEGRVAGVVCRGKQIPANAVVLATGGSSYPATGSTGDGYKLAASAGHPITPCRPALVPLEVAGDTAPRLADLALRNVRVELWLNGRKHRTAFGEMAFTATGVTGPVILSLSGDAVDALVQRQAVLLAVDLKPALDEDKLDRRLLRDLAGRGGEPMRSLLGGLLPRALIPVCLEQAGFADGTRRGSTVTAEERRRLLRWLKDFRLQVTGHRSFKEAIVTAGGVDTREVNPTTMESRLVPGLFIAGELLDVHADTGGYNLQAAFSTGWLAGQAAALRVDS